MYALREVKKTLGSPQRILYTVESTTGLSSANLWVFVRTDRGQINSGYTCLDTHTLARGLHITILESMSYTASETLSYRTLLLVLLPLLAIPWRLRC